jgi:Histidine kinase
MMKIGWQPIVLHIIGWVIFVTLPVMVVPHPPGVSEAAPINDLLLFLMITAIPLVAIFYGNLLYGFPVYYLHRRYLAFALFLALSLSASIGCTFLIFETQDWVQEIFGQVSGILMRGMIYRTAVVVVASFGLFIYRQWRLAETAKAVAELAFLKAQINPHFLFNTLNSIYYLTLQRSERAAHAVEKLSAIMRYVIDEGGQDRVPLERDVAYLHDYIALQQLRFAGNVEIVFEVKGDLVGKQIVPLLLVSLIENAFKHGISMEHPSPIHISIAVSSNQLRLDVQNHKFPNLAAHELETGIGLENTRRRLKISYPSLHRLEIHETKEDFQVTLTIEKL